MKMALQHRQREEDLKEVLSTDAGKRFVWGMLARCRVFQPIMVLSAVTGDLIAAHTFANEGARNIGLELISQIEQAAPLVWAGMVKDRALASQAAMQKTKKEQEETDNA